MINLSINELKLVAKSISIKVYENKSETELIKILSKLEPKWKFFKPKIKEIRGNIYRMDAKKMKEIEKKFFSIRKESF